MTASVFEDYHSRVYRHRWAATLEVDRIVGGVPSDPEVASAWIKSKMTVKDDELQALVIATMADRQAGGEPVTKTEAAKIVADLRHLNGFKRDPTSRPPQLCIEGRHVKAAIKEAVGIALGAGTLPARGWGRTNKGALSFVKEHVVVLEDTIPLGVSEPTGVEQRFISTFRGTGIQYEEYVEGARVEFTVKSDWPFTADEWGVIWATAEDEGRLGASRSQGYGRFRVTRWDSIGT